MKRSQGITEHFLRLRRRLNKWNKVIVAMAAVVVFATVYALILPAVTLNKNTAEQTPGINLEQEMTDFAPTLKAEKGDYVVGIKYGDDAGIPDGAKLEVSAVKKSSDTYKDAKKAVVKANETLAERNNESFDEKDLGFAALDISIVDADGNEVEPKSDADVQVKIAMRDLPAAAAMNGVTVQHIVKKADLEADAAASAPSAGDLVAQGVGGKTAVDGDKQGTAEFSVGSFSTFTITWSMSETDKTRIGSVALRYVTDQGLEKDLADDQTVSVGDLSKIDGGMVKVSDWAKTLSDTGYNFDHAAIGSRDGTTITGLKVAKGTETRKVASYDWVAQKSIDVPVTVTTYKLYYTTDATVNTTDPNANNWTEYKDSASGNPANNAMVYLIYKDVRTPVTIHYVTKNGQVITDSAGKAITVTLDASDWGDTWQNIPGFSTYINAYTIDSTVDGHGILVGADENTPSYTGGSSLHFQTYGSYTGQSFRFIRYYNGQFEVGDGSAPSPLTTRTVSSGVNKTWTVNGAFDVYVAVQESETLSTATFHHVDQYGAQLADNQIWNSNNNGSNYENKWNGSSTVLNGKDSYHQPGIGEYQKSYIGYFGKDGYSNANGSTIYGALQYKHDSDGWHTGVGASAGQNPAKEFHAEGTTDKPVLLTDVYQVYSGMKGLTIHYVDTAGNELQSTTDGNAFSSGSGYTAPTSATAKKIDNYTFQEARAGSATGSTFSNITYKQADDGTWSNTVDGNEAALVNDVYLVYRSDASKTFTVHYDYVKSDGSISGNAYYNGDTNKTTDSFTLNPGETKQLVKDDSTTSGYADIIHDAQDDGHGVQTSETGAKNPLNYLSTHAIGSDGPAIQSVEVDSSGKIIYHVTYTYGLTRESTTSNRWIVAEAQSGGSDSTNGQQGRRFSVTRNDEGNLTLQDSQNGNIDLNYANDAAGTSDAPVLAAYTATFHGENRTTEYTVRQTDNSYSLEVEESLPSDSTDIYQLYIDGDNEGTPGKLWIEDDLKYSGLLRVGRSGQLRDNMDGASNISYEWHRVTLDDTETLPTSIDDSSNAKYPVVERKITGDHYNREDTSSIATWLDVEADEGDDVWTKGTTHAYYVKLTYTPKPTGDNPAPQPVSIYSTPVSVNYYGQLENGSFEDVTPAAQYSNEEYKKRGGVWQTTGPGSTRGTSYAGRDIEIVDGTNHSNLEDPNAYHWQNGDKTKTSWAEDGNYFAELNAENAGALYQDVITHPNESLSYKFSHRARGSNEADGLGYKYDTMYLVIMPTSLAMTSGDHNTELRSQTELEKFIRDHGGFDSRPAYAETDEITYRDADNGILIRKVSSDENNWHNVDISNGYIAKGGLTRFFYVAATTAGDLGRNQAHNLKDPPTIGNFIDGVSFSQSLPTPKGYNFVATKTFSGLTQSQIAAMASSTTDSDGEKITNAKPFTITVKTENRNTNVDDAGRATALNRTKLQFTATRTSSGSDGYTFVPTATMSDDHTPEKFSYSVRTNDDGSVTMTWTLPEQSLPSGYTNGSFNYTVSESNDDVAGYTVTPTYSATTGSAWTQYFAATDLNASNISDENQSLQTASPDSRQNVAMNTQLIVAQASDGKEVRYLAWTEGNDELTSDQKQIIINKINSLTWNNTQIPSEQNDNVNPAQASNSNVTFEHGRKSYTITPWTDYDNLSVNYVPAKDGPGTIGFVNSASSSGSEATRVIQSGITAQYNFSNSYEESEVSQIKVQKVFSGVTWTTVDRLLRNGYNIKVTKTNTDTGSEISGKPTLQLDRSATTAYPGQVTGYSEDTDAKTGRVTLTWTIREIADSTTGTNGNANMGAPGTYFMTEAGYTPTPKENEDQNSLTSVTVNGKNVTDSTKGEATLPNGTKVETITQSGIKVGATDASSPTIVVQNEPQLVTTDLTNSDGFKEPSDSTNFIIAKANDGQHYLVWTRDAAGANLRQAILTYINSVTGLGTGEGTTAANLSYIDFASGDNPGAMTFDDNSSLAGLVMTYAGESLTFSQRDGSTVGWASFIAGKYTVSAGSAYDGMTNDDTEIRIGNSYEPIVKLTKVDANNNGGTTQSGLQGAVFRLYKKAGSEKKYLLEDAGTDQSGATVPKFGVLPTNESESNANKAKVFTSDEDGVVTIGILPLDYDSTTKKYSSVQYYLEEVTAPAGYERLTRDIGFQVNVDGTVQLLDADGEVSTGTTVDPATITWADPYYNITVSNKSGIMLPNTGGPGDSVLLALAGLALVAMAAGGAYAWRRRPVGRHGV